MLRSVFCLFLAMAAVMFVAGCTDNKSDNQLKLTIKNENTDTPVSGVTAILYNQDNTSYEPENIKVSGVDGVIDFGDVGRKKISITFFYLTDPLDNDYEIESYVDVAPQVGDYFVDIDVPQQVDSCDNEYPGPNSTHVAKIAITFSQLPAEASYVDMNSPGYASYGINGTESYDYYVCPEDVQDDGKISLVMDVLDNADKIIGYAYLVNQEIVHGSTYTLAFTDTFSTLSVPATANADFKYMGISMLMGSEFIWNTYSWPWLSNQYGDDMISFAADTNTIDFTVASSLPVSAYYFYVYAEYDGNSKYKSMVAGTQDSLDLTFSDTKITQFSNNENERIIRWAQTGADAVSYQQLSFSMRYDETLPYADRQYHNWTVYLPPDATMWSIMDLPGDVITHDIPTDLTRQSSVNGIDHAFSSISYPGFDYRKFLNVEYARNLFSWEEDLLDYKFEGTSMSFTVSGDGVTYD